MANGGETTCETPVTWCFTFEYSRCRCTRQRITTSWLWRIDTGDSWGIKSFQTLRGSGMSRRYRSNKSRCSVIFTNNQCKPGDYGVFFFLEHSRFNSSWVKMDFLPRTFCTHSANHIFGAVDYPFVWRFFSEENFNESQNVYPYHPVSFVFAFRKFKRWYYKDIPDDCNYKD